MGVLDINNSAQGWGDFLVSLAEEAGRDAASLAPELALHNILSDLSLVALAYAERVNLERGKDVKQPAAVEQARTVADSEAPLGVAVPPSMAEVPGWLLDAFADLERRFGALEARVEELERNQQLNVVTPSAAYLIESDNEDIDPAAWDNIDRARAALRGMVARAHRQKSAIRQQVLARVISLARSPERDSAIDAEIRQHSARAEELGEIDAIAGAKMDEIAALDDLDQARGFVHAIPQGWPE